MLGFELVIYPLNLDCINYLIAMDVVHSKFVALTKNQLLSFSTTIELTRDKVTDRADQN